MSDKLKNQSRACVFIDSSDPTLPNQVINDARPFIKLPFPPTIDPRDLITVLPDGRVPTRAPNAFIIYRRVFIEAARAEGYNLPMTVISSMTSQSWEQEPAFVKQEYRRLGKEAYNRRNEMCPDSNQRRKRERWNLVSFNKKNSARKVKKSMRKSNISKKSSNKNQPPILSYSSLSESEKSFVANDFHQNNVLIQQEIVINNDDSTLSCGEMYYDEDELFYQSSEPDSYDNHSTLNNNDLDYLQHELSASPECNSDNFLESPLQSPTCENFENQFAAAPSFYPIRQDLVIETNDMPHMTYYNLAAGVFGFSDPTDELSSCSPASAFAMFTLHPSDLDVDPCGMEFEGFYRDYRYYRYY